MNIDLVLRQAAQLYREYPLDHSAICAKEIMGPNSCIFTWRQANGDGIQLSNNEAEAIVRAGTDIVLPVPMSEPVRLPTPATLRSLRLRAVMHRLFYSSKPLVSRSLALGVLGLAGAVLAIYGNDWLQRRPLHWTVLRMVSQLKQAARLYR